MSTAQILPGRPVPTRLDGVSEAELAAAERLMREQDARRDIARGKHHPNYMVTQQRLRRRILDDGDLDIKLALSTDESVKINPIRFFALRVLKRVRRLFGL